MRIDAHQHFTAEYTPDVLAPIFKRNRFEGSVVVCGSSDTAHHFQLAAHHDFIQAVVAWADLSAPNLGNILDSYQRHPKFRGVISSLGTEFPNPLAEFLKGLAELERRNLTFDLLEPAAIPRIAGRFPSLRLIVDHLGRPPADPDAWARDLEAAAQYPQVFGKLSGLITGVPTRWKAGDFRPYVQHALRVFGPHRLMFGSDWPAYLPEGTFKESLAAFTQSIGPLPEEVREHLLGGTAARVYRIEQRIERRIERRIEPGAAF
jgi:L-fuconolactonase